jgi:hypothetical protein
MGGKNSVELLYILGLFPVRDDAATSLATAHRIDARLAVQLVRNHFVKRYNNS